MEIVELRSEAELEGAFTVVRELHGELDERKYAELLAAMISSGYRKFAVRARVRWPPWPGCRSSPICTTSVTSTSSTL